MSLHDLCQLHIEALPYGGRESAFDCRNVNAKCRTLSNDLHKPIFQRARRWSGCG